MLLPEGVLSILRLCFPFIFGGWREICHHLGTLARRGLAVSAKAHYWQHPILFLFYLDGLLAVGALDGVDRAGIHRAQVDPCGNGWVLVVFTGGTLWWTQVYPCGGRDGRGGWRAGRGWLDLKRAAGEKFLNVLLAKSSLTCIYIRAV